MRCLRAFDDRKVRVDDWHLRSRRVKLGGAHLAHPETIPGEHGAYLGFAHTPWSERARNAIRKAQRRVDPTWRESIDELVGERRALIIRKCVEEADIHHRIEWPALESGQQTQDVSLNKSHGQAAFLGFVPCSCDRRLHAINAYDVVTPTRQEERHLTGAAAHVENPRAERVGVVKRDHLRLRAANIPGWRSVGVVVMEPATGVSAAAMSAISAMSAAAMPARVSAMPAMPARVSAMPAPSMRGTHVGITPSPQKKRPADPS
jgi:hypothetical protein